MAELRSELLQPSVTGVSPVESVLDLIELRGGHIVPSVEASKVDLERLVDLSTLLASRAILATDDLIIPTPKQLDLITFNIEQGCWDMKTPNNKNPFSRYGQLRMKSVPNPSGRAHRTMYKVFFGLDSLPNGPADFLDHICERKSCCYPRHLERVTHQENNRRGVVRTANRVSPSHPTLDI